MSGAQDVPAIPGLAAALKAVAPKADPAVWLPALTPPMISSGIITPRRIAAFLGQCAHESQGFTVLSENLNYTRPARIALVFSSHFADEAEAAPYAGQPQKLANRVYADRLGNGDEASGDGWVFRGAGLLQLTGRTEITSFGVDLKRTPTAAAVWLRTPEGAAAGACWYWSAHHLNGLAESWELAGITRAINGRAMLGAAERAAYSAAALAVLT